MSSLRLDHVTLASARMDDTIAFYGDILGLRPGPRPPLEADGVQVPGVWLYAEGGDSPIVHIVAREPKDGSTGAFDHFAIRSEGLLSFLDHLRTHAIDFKAKPVADTSDTQVHFLDPNGVKVEMIFAERADPALLGLPISQRAAAMKPSASIAAKKIVLDLQASGQEIIDLTIGEPDIATPAHIIDGALDAMRSGQTHYTSSAGTLALRRAVAEMVGREKGVACGPENVVVGCGAKQLIFEAFAATLNPGDEVIIPAPYWVSYPDIASLHGGRPVIVTCGKDVAFKLTPSKLEAAITPRTRWLVLNSPNNPTGAVYSRQELSEIAEVLRHHPHVWVMTDEIYEHLCYDGTRAPSLVEVAPFLFERALIINGTSKAYAMTGWRIGYAVGPRPLIDVIVKMIGQSTTCASSVGQAAAVVALTSEQSCVSDAAAMYQARRDRMLEILSDTPDLELTSPSGAFYLYVGVSALLGRKTPTGKVIETDLDLSLYLLEQAKVAVLDGAAYGLSPYLRLSFAASMAAVEAGSEAIVEACRALVGQARPATADARQPIALGSLARG
jgi:aspartate aminotransferase